VARPGLILVTFAITILLATLTDRRIEAPAVRFGHSLARRRRIPFSRWTRFCLVIDVPLLQQQPIFQGNAKRRFV
jgi:peptidoglycan/LPS O-acetylase OafA/YrhL